MLLQASKAKQCFPKFCPACVQQFGEVWTVTKFRLKRLFMYLYLSLFCEDAFCLLGLYGFKDVVDFIENTQAVLLLF